MSDLVAGVAALLGVDAVGARAIGGGCISETRRVDLADGRSVFAKSGAGLPAGLLAAEAEGLRWLRGANAIAVPEVLAEADAILVMEWIEPGGPSATTAEQLGRGLAHLHASGAPHFGRDRDGFIGSLPQRNTPPIPADAADAWPTFWFTRRIEPLARMALDRGSLPAAATALVERLGERLPGRVGPAEPPARVHGDLWTGNVLVDASGRPWVVDPAANGGHREVDLAMLHLFGTPATRAIEAYVEVNPLADGWRDRLRLWQLEPLLVHAVLFGGSYGADAHDVLRRFA